MERKDTTPCKWDWTIRTSSAKDERVSNAKTFDRGNKLLQSPSQTSLSPFPLCQRARSRSDSRPLLLSALRPRLRSAPPPRPLRPHPPSAPIPKGRATEPQGPYVLLVGVAGPARDSLAHGFLVMNSWRTITLRSSLSSPARYVTHETTSFKRATCTTRILSALANTYCSRSYTWQERGGKQAPAPDSQSWLTPLKR